MPRTNWQEFVDGFEGFSDDLPSAIRSRKNHDAIASLGDAVVSMKVEVQQLQISASRSDNFIENYSQRFQRIEQTVSTGTNCLITRVALLERRDQEFKEDLDTDKQALSDLKELSKLLKNFPWGLKGLFATVFIAIIGVAFVTDYAVRHYVVRNIENKIMELK